MLLYELNFLQGTWRWQYPYVKCDRIIVWGGSKGLLKSGTFLLHDVLSVSLNPVSLGQWKDRYKWMDGEIYVWQSCVEIGSYSVTSYHLVQGGISLSFRFSLLRSLSSTFTGTFPLWSSLSFTSSLSSVPSMTSLPSLSRTFVQSLCSTSSSVSLISGLSPIFSDDLFLRWLESSSGIHGQQNL